MPKRIADLQNELDEYRAKGTILEQACTKLLSLEAAFRVLSKHNLWIEFAEELMELKRPSNGTGTNP